MGYDRETSTSDTDSELLPDRERSVSMSAGPPGPLGPGAGGGLGGGGWGSPAWGGCGGGGVGAGGSGCAGPAVLLLPPQGGAAVAAGGGGAALSPMAAALQRRLSDAQGHGGAGSLAASVGLGAALPCRSPSRGVAPLPRGPLVDCPTSPTDCRFGGGLDLRKTALLRSLSRRTEDALTSDGGTAAAAATTTAAPGGGVGGLPAVPETGPECAPAALSPGFAFAPHALLRAQRGLPGGPGAAAAMAAATRSCSVASDAMSDGGGGGGPVGMDTSSTSAAAAAAVARLQREAPV
ncbi:hypothetical protein GPECTOR_4g945 [Gonium pectorale]|uniref:Uncharacterized protein n=1 Tax=Gonium pectorale TaxID=33097 RepID=A0A150GYP1_GONPE|nr:hypothetical protein GPECTOR_4g945 [Gonium pectorale]|eukprot:KXZ54873.1 hypothetical protein GPECTOR_4g945 [Gonium pectorale]